MTTVLWVRVESVDVLLVNSFMFNLVAQLSKWLSAHAAVVWLFSSVSSDMSLQMSLLSKRLAADLAAVRSLSGMSPQVKLERRVVDERLRADVAVEILLAAVNLQVKLEVIGVTIVLAAHLAEVLHLRVDRGQVRLQARHQGERLAAAGRRADVWAVAGVHGVVVLQTRKIGKPFTAEVTRELLWPSGLTTPTHSCSILARYKNTVYLLMRLEVRLLVESLAANLTDVSLVLRVRLAVSAKVTPVDEFRVAEIALVRLL